MKLTKRIVAIVLCVLLVVSTVVVFAACSGSFNVKWDNYVMDLNEGLKKYGSGMPKVSTTNKIPTGVSVETSYIYDGLVVLTPQLGTANTYGYLVASDTVFGQSDSLIDLRSDKTNYTNTYIGVTTNGMRVLYDVKGNKLATNNYISTSFASTTVAGKTTRYLQVEATNSSGETQTSYYKINKDGTLASTKLATLPTEESSLPQKGDVFATDGTTLADWLDVEIVTLGDGEAHDAMLQEVTVQTHGNSAVFYRKGKKLSELTMPNNIDVITYVDGKIVYTTLTPVDSAATKGYNYVSGSQKYNSKTFSFNIKTGSTKELKVDYVINSVSALMYNKKSNVFDMVAVYAYRMVDGIAWARTDYKESLFINKNGAVGYSDVQSPYGMPVVKVGKNYVTSELNLVNKNGKLLASLGSASFKSIVSDGIVVTVDGKVGTVGFDGKVKVPFEYDYSGQVYGNYIVVTDKSKSKLVLNLATGKTTSLKTLTKASNENNVVVDGYFVGSTNDSRQQYNWYLMDGTAVATELNGPINLMSAYVLGERYGFAQVVKPYGTVQYLRLVF